MLSKIYLIGVYINK